MVFAGFGLAFNIVSRYYDAVRVYRKPLMPLQATGMFTRLCKLRVGPLSNRCFSFFPS